MKFLFALATIISAQSWCLSAQDSGLAKQESKPEATQTPAESDEHVYARKQYVLYLGKVYDDLHDPSHWNDQTAYRSYPFDKLALKIKALVEGEWNSVSEKDAEWNSISNQLAQELFSTISNRETKALNLSFARLQHADDCAKVYKGTVDKKVSDLTTRETDMMKACKSIGSYPSPNGH
jgi:hypothetical protein